jgi:outer membrane lipoprotein-sorting protein
VNIFRRLPLYRLLLLCGLVLAAGVSATAIAFALSTGPTPPPEPLASAIHDALSAPAVEGLSANVQLTDRLLEGANLTGGGQAGELASSPLISGASGRLWIAKDGRLRLELQAEQGDTEIFCEGSTISLYDAATNTLYRYTPPAHGDAESTTGPSSQAAEHHEAPSVGKIEEAISHLSRHVEVSGATPTDVAGQPAYTVRVSPKEAGSLLGGAELSFDAVHGVPLRAAIYSSTSSSPVIELAATEVSYGPVEDSVFEFTPPANAKIDEITSSENGGANASESSAQGEPKPKLTIHGHGVTAIAVIEGKAGVSDQETATEMEGLPQVKINGATATELRTALGTLLSFERSGVRYLLAGSVTPAAVEEVARGL